MEKILFLLLVTLCIVQNFQRTLAISEEDFDDDNSFQNLFKFKLADALNGISDSLYKYYETEVEKLIKFNEIALLQIFKSAEKDIEELSEDSSTTVMQCFKMAQEELDDLNEKIKEDSADCIVEGGDTAKEVIDNLERILLEKAQSVIQDYIMNTVVCAQNLDQDDLWVSSCLNLKQFLKIIKAIEEYGSNLVDDNALILNQVVKDVTKCLKEVRIDALSNTEHVTEEMEYCSQI